MSLGDVREQPVQVMGLSGEAAEPVDLPGEGETWKQRFKVEADLAYQTSPFIYQIDPEQQDTTFVIRAGIFRVAVTELNRVPLDVFYDDSPWLEVGEIEEGFLSDYGNVSVDFARNQPATAPHVPLGEARASLRKVGEIADSLAAEGYNVWGSPTTPSRASLYASHGMIRVGDLPRHDDN
ncbi:MAG: hypothetical protein QF522_10080, partial [Acidimicrobiales bacterium]|nr:hypothetical protein [Acidimicrobiales bacterium]